MTTRAPTAKSTTSPVLIQRRMTPPPLKCGSLRSCLAILCYNTLGSGGIIEVSWYQGSYGCGSAEPDDRSAQHPSAAGHEAAHWKNLEPCATVLLVGSVRRTQSKTAGGTGRGSGPGLGSRRYLTRGRLGFLAVSEGGRSLTIMVGPLRGPEHLELIRRAWFYHVPVSAIAASRTAVAYIAFYEGASRFHARTGVIREYAAVVRVSRVRRCDLPGLTWPARGAPDAPYYRFDLGPIQQLPRPITNPERLRVAFRFPNFERFREAATLRELGNRESGKRKAEEREENSLTGFKDA
jgi:hypothetical protein